jgi:diguanylate cyclase (GGDEF)-like protein/PAS domain S-box-containing protein
MRLSTSGLNFSKSPLARISFGLVMVTVTVLVLSDLVGMVPDTRRVEIHARKVIAESLAVQFSMILADEQLQTIQETLRYIVERNPDILSAGLRQEPGGLLADFGEHNLHWQLQPGEDSTAAQIQVPLFNREGRWGTVELNFVDLAKAGEHLSWSNSFLGVILLVALLCYVGYFMLLKRTMRELDPSAVIPERVRLALDTLSEGLLILEQNGYIVFSNRAFAQKTGLTAKDLVGREIKSLPWVPKRGEDEVDSLVWSRFLNGDEVSSGDSITVNLASGLEKVFTFVLNGSQIASTEGEVRGALITFDDVTEVERKNTELKRTLGILEHSQQEITRQNKELHVLATRDPLTGLLNRRSFFQNFEMLFAGAGRLGGGLSCIVVDIDHFKRVNDNYGHSVGDRVITMLANVLTECSRPNDIVGRFGGEEFCIVLPGVEIYAAAGIAHRMRRVVQGTVIKEFNGQPGITISIGVSDLSQGAKDIGELFDQADKALYVAKETGRNKVVRWPLNAVDGVAPVGEGQVAATEAEKIRGVGGSAVPVLSAVVDGENANVVESTDDNEDDYDFDSDFMLDSIDVPLYPTQSLLVDRINQAVIRSERFHTMVGVMVLEFEMMQRVMETWGLAVGGKLEEAIMERITDVLRTTDTVAVSVEDELFFSVLSHGGREIVVLLTDLKSTEVIAPILQRMFVATSAPIDTEEAEVYAHGNVGVSIYPVDTQDGNSLLSYASSAMREAKKAVGYNNWQFYSEEVNMASKRQLRLESDLHVAVERGQLVLYYQPKVCLRTGSILGMEALLRWDHPELGKISPVEFIALAEQSDLIDTITDKVIATACQQVLDWQNAGYGFISVAVNLSPVSFRDPGIGDRIIAELSKYDIPVRSLEVEITETAVVDHMQSAIEILELISNTGLSVAIDDFGVGYSSFSYLKSFPVSKVKIDRSFIVDIGRRSIDEAIVGAMISMAHSLGIAVVAEGVETEAELRLLQDLHCDELQGFLISPPLPAAGISELLTRSAEIKRMILREGVKSKASRSATTGIYGVINDYEAGQLSVSSWSGESSLPVKHSLS